MKWFESKKGFTFGNNPVESEVFMEYSALIRALLNKSKSYISLSYFVLFPRMSYKGRRFFADFKQQFCCIGVNTWRYCESKKTRQENEP